MRLLSTMLVFSVLFVSGCPDKKAKYPICAEDKDCKEGEHCINKQCVQCGTDAHCDKGHTCEDGACVKTAGFCKENSDCPTGKACKANKCTSCTADADCGPDSRCTDDGRCLARGTCTKDEDCKDDEDCVDGKCQRLGRGPSPNVDCQLQSVFFDFDRSGIPETSKDAVNTDAECIQQAADRKVLLIGHTDPRGTDEYNIALSEARAQSVADYIARLGVDPARFRVVPKGEAEAAGSDEMSWGRDRRVDIEWQ